MKKLTILLLFLILIAGCKKEVVIQQPIVVEVPPQPVILGIAVNEVTTHKYIVGKAANGIFLALETEITNAGAEKVIITTDEIILKQGQNTYPLDRTVSYKEDKRFTEFTLYKNNAVNARLVFDVPTTKGDYILVIKGKELKI